MKSAYFNKRFFTGKAEQDMRKQIVNSGNHSFVITVRNRENHTWQGTVSWIEGKKQENFRSVLELLKLMDSAISNGEDIDELNGDNDN